MKRASPLTQLTMALVALSGLLVVLADLFFGAIPSRQDQLLQTRKQIGEAVAVQVTTLLREGNREALRRTLEEVAARTSGVKSLALRRADGSILVEAGGHDKHWHRDHTEDAASSADAIFVPLDAGGKPWGSFEMAFEPSGGTLRRWLTEPLVLTMLFISLAGTLVFRLYVRRALQHLDPSSVIPERVQSAFDAMNEGVVVLDAKGRLLLANKAYRTLRGADAEIGARLSSQEWVQSAFGHNDAAHPWARVLEERQPLAGVTAEIRTTGGELRQIVTNCAPVTDAAQRVRGCILTFADVTELHRTNAALRETLAELAASKNQVQRQNDELQRLATRDPMTGCLNRRSFMDLYKRMFVRAKSGDSALGVIVLDIDFFKRVNDTHGHTIGDRVIQEVAKKVAESARSADLVCRYGGEEFVVVAAGLSPAAMMHFAERIRSRVQAECGPGVREVPGMHVTVSLGVAVLQGDVVSEQVLIDRADEALYRAKNDGRNQVKIWRPQVMETGAYLEQF
jgi:diguanylate cyclase (GGDEF)-like protein/PAS domain S-box-containing protein